MKKVFVYWDNSNMFISAQDVAEGEGRSECALPGANSL